MYQKDYDWSSAKWHVFFVHDGKWDWKKTFDTANEAQDYCDIQNGALCAVDKNS